ncbi:AsmA family protein [Methylobacterium sp. J-068]|uniref:AsmA family protein n=1 Tax=Methylobacterium sp. J-068 TaxID=2836649 RepID=UPI001FBAAD39|nr:AsmA family protein [Methylobacterium sp. J-068]MCJ2034865.1 AsmA family protein [Methylobacterium sp. J-068]
MPLHRLIPLASLGALTAGLACACLPWSVTAPGLTRFVARELARSYGVTMLTEGPTEVALLPLPRLAFGRVRLSAGGGDGPVLAEGGTLSLQLNLLPLFTGRIDVNTLGLDGATIRLPTGSGDSRWAEPVRLLEARLGADAAAHPRRVSLSRATATGSDPRDGTPQTARDIDLSLSWPLWSAQSDLSGSFRWNAAPARFAVSGLRLADLLGGGASPFALSAAWPAGSLAAEGNGLVRDGGLKLTGRGTFETRSLPETMAWAGGAVALAPFVEAFGLDGSFDMDGRLLLLPNVRVSFGANELEGAGAVAFDRTRPAIQATLAAETLNLAPLLAEALRMLGLDASGEAAPGRGVALAPLTGGDLDLRLSAGAARIGPVVTEDIAASVLVRDGSIEAALNRATLATGTLKGRLALNASAADPAVTEMKAQGAFERLDLTPLLDALRQEPWALGQVQGQFLAEGSGATAGRLLNHLNGHAVLGVDGGTLVGLDLADVAQRHRVPVRRAGRTPFERATLTLRFVDGIGQITEGVLEGPGLSASLRGTVMLPDWRCEALAEVAARSATAGEGRSRPAQFLIGGPLGDLTARVVTREPDPALRGGSNLAPNALRMPASGGDPRLPAAARAYAQ